MNANPGFPGAGNPAHGGNFAPMNANQFYGANPAPGSQMSLGLGRPPQPNMNMDGRMYPGMYQ